MIDGRDVIVTVYETDRLGIIDVFYNEMAFVSGDDSHPVCLRIDTGLQTCHFSILIKEGNVFLSVDSGLCLAAGRTHVFDVRTKRHGREIEGIDPDVQ